MKYHKNDDNQSSKLHRKKINFRNTCIFAIDDLPDNIALYSVTLERICKKYGFEMKGDKKIEKLLKFGYADIILLDLNLPDTDGFELFKIIKSHKVYEDTDIIAISASEPETILPRLIKLGFAGLITKPINISGFPNQLRKILYPQQFIHIEYIKPNSKFRF